MITDKKIDNVTQLQIVDDKKQITEKKSVISACNVDYRLKRSGLSNLWSDWTYDKRLVYAIFTSFSII